jgi:hypothetical protein
MLNRHLRLFLLTGIALISSIAAQAVTYYWYGKNSTDYNLASNWSTTNTGYTASAVVPGAVTTDVAAFGNYPGITTQTCSWTMTVAKTLQGIDIQSSYTGTFTRTGAFTLTIGASAFKQAGGTFTSSSGTITSAVALQLSGGTFNLGSTTLNLTTATGSITQTGGAFNGGTGTITINGDFTVSGSTATFTSTSGTLTLRKSFTFSSTAASAFTHNNGTVTFSNTSTTALGFNVSGSNLTFNNLVFTGPTAATACTLTVTSTTQINVNGLMTISGAAPITINKGVTTLGEIRLLGNLTLSNTSTTVTNGTGLLNFVGTGAQTLTGNVAASGVLCHVSVTKSAGSMNLSNAIRVSGNWTNTLSGAATFLAGTSTLNLVGTGTTLTAQTFAFNNLTVTGSTRSLASNLVLNGNLLLANSTSNLNASGFNLSIGGNWTNTGGSWTPSTGTVTFNGTLYKSVRKTTGLETFSNVTVNKVDYGIQLQGLVQVTGTLTLTAGKIKTTTTNYLKMAAGSVVSGGSNTAYVYGAMEKIGNTVFVFPIGDSLAIGSPYHPMGISAPASASDAYLAEYKAVAQTAGTAKATSIGSVSSCEHWLLKRTAPASGTTTLTPTLNWNANCNHVNYSEMTFAAWNGSLWFDYGVGTLNGTSPQGSIGAATVVSFTNNTTTVQMTIAKKAINTSYAVLTQDLAGGYYFTNGAVLYFRYNEEYKDADGYLTYQVIDLTTNLPVSLFANSTTQNVPVFYGANQYKMDLYTAANTPLAAGNYLLVVTNDKNEAWQLRFQKN